MLNAFTFTELNSYLAKCQEGLGHLFVLVNLKATLAQPSDIFYATRGIYILEAEHRHYEVRCSITMPLPWHRAGCCACPQSNVA